MSNKNIEKLQLVWPFHFTTVYICSLSCREVDEKMDTTLICLRKIQAEQSQKPISLA